MEINAEYFNQRREKAEALYNNQRNVYNPYFKSQVVFNSDGFHHL